MISMVYLMKAPFPNFHQTIFMRRYCRKKTMEGLMWPKGLNLVELMLIIVSRVTYSGSGLVNVFYAERPFSMLCIHMVNKTKQLTQKHFHSYSCLLPAWSRCLFLLIFENFLFAYLRVFMRKRCGPGSVQDIYIFSCRFPALTICNWRASLIFPETDG